MTKFFKNNFLILLILVIAAALRLINLTNNPIGFNDDEAAFGYNGYSIGKTAMDEWGRFMPFPAFESFGDWKLVGYLYPVVISEKILGPSVFSARLPSALFGIGAVFSAYLLTLQLFKEDKYKKYYALIASFLMAISPWHIIASRNAFESDVLILTISLFLYFFLKALADKKYFKYSLICFVISFYIYRSAWVFLPLISFILYFVYRKQFKRLPIKYFILTGITLVPIVFLVLTFKGQSRFIQESFISGVSRTGIVNEINQRRGVCNKYLPDPACRLALDKYISFTATYFNNYFENLSPQVYFTQGSPTGYQAPFQRGLLYAFELPLLVTGLILLIKRRDNTAKLLGAWVLLVPIGASFTGVGNPGRLNIIMPAPQIIEAYGLVAGLLLVKNSTIKKALIVAMSVIIVISASRFLLDMFYYYPQVSGQYQRYGYKQLFDYLESQKDHYEEIAISRKTDDSKQYIHYLFFEKVDPYQVIYSQFTRRHRDSGGWQVFEQTGNFFFYGSTPALGLLPPKTLLAVGNKEVNYPVKPVFTVDYPNGDRAFEVYDADAVKLTLLKLNQNK